MDRTFSLNLPLLDLNDWEESYLRMINWGDRSFSNTSPKFIVTPIAELQYYIYHGLANDESWLLGYIPRQEELKSELVRMSKNAIPQIDYILNKFRNTNLPKDAYPLGKYSKKFDGHYDFHIDKFNRFVFEPKGNNSVEINAIMFHYRYDVPTDPSDKNYAPYKVRLCRLYNDLILNLSLQPNLFMTHIEELFNRK